MSSQVEKAVDNTPPSVFKRIAELEDDKRQLERALYQFKRLMNEPRERQRTRYPHPWKCIDCGALTERPRRRRCPACYIFWLRGQNKATHGYRVV